MDTRNDSPIHSATRRARAGVTPFHAVMIAGARKANTLSAFAASVASGMENMGESSRGAIKLGKIESRRAQKRSARVLAYVANRACR